MHLLKILSKDLIRNNLITICGRYAQGNKSRTGHYWRVAGIGQHLQSNF